jgi:hypothetical protein
MPRQDSLTDQMHSVIMYFGAADPTISALLEERFARPFTAHPHDRPDLATAKQAANRLGCYDAADWIERQIHAI